MSNDERVLILMPTAKDGDRACQALHQAGLDCAVCRDIKELCQEIERGAGAALLTEEALTGDRGDCLYQALKKQPPWSDFPLVVLAREGANGHTRSLGESLNVTLVERPLRMRSLLSLVRSALRSRRRQYEVRDHLVERDRAEDKLKRLAAIVESSGDAIISKNLDGIIQSWNEAAENLFGYTPAEAVGQPITLIIPRELHDEEKAILSRLRRGERIEHFETTRVAKDGRRMDLSLTISPVRDRDGRIVGASKVARDITARKQVEKAFRESEANSRRQTERLRLLWEAASVLLTTEEPDAMMRGLFAKIAPHFGLDAYFNFMVNDAGDALLLESCLGIPDDAVASIRRLDFGQAVSGLVAQKRSPMTVTHIQESDDPRVQMLKSLGIRCDACSPLLAGNRLLGTLSFASKIRDTFEPDELEFLSTICRYVTVAYERLMLVRELRETDRKKDDFIALLAHELRNPLAPIRNGLQVLRLADGDIAAISETREMMDRQLTHMVRLVDDLLDVSRISRNKMELRREPVLLAEVVSTAVEAVRPLIDAAGHELTVSLPANSIYLNADLTRLAQVLGNLLSNSSKYTAPAGHIRLSARRDQGMVAISVSDNGIGIPAASLDTIFDMFSQVDRSIERSTGGLGIGLALVKGLVEMHGGSVKAESAGEGQGSTFTVNLPLSDPVESAPVLTNGSAAKHPGRRVLVVDDNRDGGDSLAMMLRLMGNEVRTATDGVQAIAEAEEFRPEMILMDVGMPRLNGLDATRRIRQQPWGREMTIVALTGWGQENDRERSREAGCDEHLIKPVNLADLQKILEGVDGGKKN